MKTLYYVTVQGCRVGCYESEFDARHGMYQEILMGTKETDLAIEIEEYRKEVVH